MFEAAVRAYRATGADLPYGHPLAGHPGVTLESWSWRLVDPATRTVVLLAATAVAEVGGVWLSVVLAAQHADGSRSVVERALGEVHSSPRSLAVEAGNGRFSANPGRLVLDLGPDAQLDVHIEEPFGWPRRALGGLGLGHVVPGLSQYWHPHLLGGTVRGRAVFGSRTVALDGATAYGEKNWGRSGIPRAWWWGQATCAPEVVLAFAGGTLDVGPARVPATAVAVRVGDGLAAFSPPLALISCRMGPRTWALDARSARWRVRVRATAEGEPFDLPVPVPGEQRTELLSHQHQDGELALTVWRDGRRRFAGTTSLAGLERGGRGLT